MFNDTLSPAYRQDALAQRIFLTKVYGWMAVGLGITASAALAVSQSKAALHFVYGQPAVIWVLFGLEILMVFGLSAAVNRMPPIVATGLFVLYAALNGVSLSFLLLIYTHATLVGAFFITAGTFSVMCVVGAITRIDLSSLGSACFMLLIGLILASIVNFFLHSSGLELLLNYLGVAIFVGLTAYDSQKIKYMYMVGADGSAANQRAAIIGALRLYLDFINLFLFILSIMGRNRD